MRCSNCGLPLSPSRTHCPRCGTARAVQGPSGAAQSTSSLQQGGGGAVQLSTETPQQSQSTSGPSSQWNVQGGASFAQHLAPTAFKTTDEQVPFPLTNNSFNNAFAPSPSQDAEASMTPRTRLQEPVSGTGNQLWLSPPPITPVPASPQTPDWAQGALSPSGNDRLTKLRGTALRFFLAPEEEPRTIQPGFTVAGLCVIVGGLILIFVHFMALSLAPVSSQLAAEPTRLAISPITPVATVSISPTPSPTPEFPAQQYIDSAQMASAVNGGLPTQVTTNFKVGQQINVTFMVHPSGHSGAVCLLWYLNNQQITHYEFPVAAYNTARPASSYAILGGAGTGSVELYWASTTACEDKQLAQRLIFNVN